MVDQSDSLPPLVSKEGMYPGAVDALRHWREHRPKMYTQLYEQGTLCDVASAAFEATVDDEMEIQDHALIKQGYGFSYSVCTSKTNSKRAVRIYLPTEEDVPELSKTESGLYVYQPDETG